MGQGAATPMGAQLGLTSPPLPSAPEFYIQQLCGHAIWIFLNLFQLTVVKPEATAFLLPHLTRRPLRR